LIDEKGGSCLRDTEIVGKAIFKVA
jgi:hypothetical protein